MLDFARESKADRVLYISSNEVYGKKGRQTAAREDDYGFIDVLLPRNAYSIGKRAVVTLCVSYAEEYGVESVIVHPHDDGPRLRITLKRGPSFHGMSYESVDDPP